MSSASNQDRQDRTREAMGQEDGLRVESERRRYEKPRLEVLGDVRDVTLGVSPGSGDSNDPVNLRF